MENETLQALISQNLTQFLSIFIITVFTIFSAILTCVYRSVIKDLVSRPTSKLFNLFRKKKHKLTERQIEYDQEIVRELNELRIKYVADRTAVFKFHNGEVFTTSEPIWKISNTHETCSNPIKSVIQQCQDIKSPLFIDILTALFKKEEPAGTCADSRIENGKDANL